MNFYCLLVYCVASIKIVHENGGVAEERPEIVGGASVEVVDERLKRSVMKHDGAKI